MVLRTPSDQRINWTGRATGGAGMEAILLSFGRVDKRHIFCT